MHLAYRTELDFQSQSCLVESNILPPPLFCILVINHNHEPYLAYKFTNCIFNWKSSEVKIYILCQNRQTFLFVMTAFKITLRSLRYYTLRYPKISSIPKPSELQLENHKQSKGPMPHRQTHRGQVQPCFWLLMYLEPSECPWSGWETRGQANSEVLTVGSAIWLSHCS